MRIRKREIGENAPPYVIAEIGVNHDGDAERALALVRAADAAGADAVKFQFFRAGLLMSRAARLAAYQREAGENDPVEMLARLELSVEELGPAVDLAFDLGLHSIVTVFSVELVEEAMSLPWDAVKSASPDIINRPLLDALAATGRPLIVSTGASTLAEVERAAGWLAGAHERLALLQCVSAYPTPIDRNALGGLRALRRVFRGPLGYSDHTPDIETGALAVAAGACVLEKHLTLDPSAPGPDHAASLDPASMQEYIRHARVARRSTTALQRRALTEAVPIGPAEKTVLDIERDVRAASRQSLVATRDLPAGHVLTRADLTIKRPGTGVEPWRLDEILGRPLTRAVEADMPLAEGDVVLVTAHAA